MTTYRMETRPHYMKGRFTVGEQALPDRVIEVASDEIMKAVECENSIDREERTIRDAEDRIGRLRGRRAGHLHLVRHLDVPVDSVIEYLDRTLPDPPYGKVSEWPIIQKLRALLVQ